jgi:cysteinyl-tRNA synthetase
MVMANLGEPIDLHGGGLDLIFPHHENEVAITEVLTGRPFARHWMHNGFVEIDKQKMSKSLGNFFTARTLFERVEPEALRYYALSVHYRAPLAFECTTDEEGTVTGFPQLEEAEGRVEYVYRTRERVAQLRAADAPAPQASTPGENPGDALEASLGAALDDDLNTPAALAALARFLRAVNDLADVAARRGGKTSAAALSSIERGFAAVDARLGIGGDDAASLLDRVRARRARLRGIDEAEVAARIADRARARASRDFAGADAIRAELAERGIEVLDRGDGTVWRFR